MRVQVRAGRRVHLYVRVAVHVNLCVCMCISLPIIFSHGTTVIGSQHMADVVSPRVFHFNQASS